MSEFIITYTGRKVFPFNIKPEDLCIEDIAHALSNKCRFTGHTKDFYSVAQHSLLVAEECALLISSSLWGLLHDAGEAYLPDVATGLKCQFPEMQLAELKILKAVQEKFSLPALSIEEKRRLKEIDRFVLYWEGRLLMPEHEEATWGRSVSFLSQLDFDAMGPVKAKQNFLDFYYKHIGAGCNV